MRELRDVLLFLDQVSYLLGDSFRSILRVSNFDAVKRQSQGIVTLFELHLTSAEHQRTQVDNIFNCPAALILSDRYTHFI